MLAWDVGRIYVLNITSTPSKLVVIYGQFMEKINSQLTNNYMMHNYCDATHRISVNGFCHLAKLIVIIW